MRVRIRVRVRVRASARVGVRDLCILEVLSQADGKQARRLCHRPKSLRVRVRVMGLG